MLFQIKQYCRFILKSRNHHGVHSPFVYELLTKVFYDKTPKLWYPILKKYRKSLLRNQEYISIQDFGAGSKSLSNKRRRISELAKTAGISSERAALLSRIVSHFKTDLLLEIGTSLGLGTASLSLGNNLGQVITLEGCTNTASVAKKQFEIYGLNNIKLYEGNFKDSLPKVLKNRVFDLVFFDGNHQKEATLNYFQQCLQHHHENSIFIFDDINWSRGMQEAWQEIQDHPSVTLSIDTFYWGLVFFRKEQTKQHFVIRT